MPIAEKSVIAQGFDLIGQVLMILFIISLIAIFLFILWWVAKRFFFNINIPDIVKVEKDRTVASCYLSCPPTIYDHKLFLVGRGRTGMKHLGQIKGHTEEEVRVDVPTGKKKKVKNEEGETIEKELYKQTDIKQDVFLVNVHRLHWLPLFGRFLSKLIIVKVLADEHTELVGDINVFSSGLREEKGYWYTTERINKGIVTITDDMQQRLERVMLLEQLQAEGVISGLVTETNVRLIHDLSRREGLLGRVRKQEAVHEKE